MNKITTLSTALLLATGFAASAAAYQAPNMAGKFYLAPAFGAYLTDNNRNMDNGGVADLAVGYNFDKHFAAQVVAGALNTSGPGYFLRVEGLLNIPTHSPIVPYLALGAGSLKVKHSQFAADAGAGIRYFVSDHLGFGVNYRHMVQMTGTMHEDNSITFGAFWAFGSVPFLSEKQPAHHYQPVKKLTQKQEAVLKKAKTTLKYVLPHGVVQCNVNGASPRKGCVTLKGNKLTMHLDVKFQKNRSFIRSMFTPAIDRVAHFMKRYTTTDATLFGYASSEGPLAYNQKLSQKRASQVRTYLIKQGIGAKRLKAVGKGISNPVASNKTKAGRELNRRVEAAVTVPIKPTKVVEKS